MDLPSVARNRLSYAGGALAALSFIVFVFLVILHTLGVAARSPYAGILIFILVPAFLLLGLGLVVLGVLLEARRRRRTAAVSAPRLPVIDLNDSRTRNAFLLFAGVSLVVLFSTVFGSYEAYELTESRAFCGQTCHTPMEPEFTASQLSPHAVAGCVDCHVGPGPDWYVRSKLAGVRQLVGVIFDSYPRPIAAPVKNMRSADETCGHCHWPQQFFGREFQQRVHFLSDEKNTRWTIDLLLDVGGRRPPDGPSEGIHRHASADQRVEYVASDAQLQTIPWVRVTDRTTGKVVEYASTDAPLPPDQLARAKIRTLECIGCHNRVGHAFPAPGDSVNLALAGGRIDPDLPFVKQTAVQLLAGEHPSRAAALDAIQKGLAKSLDAIPELAAQKREETAQAVAEVQAIYRRSIFPAMKVRWDTHPDNTGHLRSPGCMRCHDGLHRSTDGKVIANGCDTCHRIVSQGTPEKRVYASSLEGIEFEHPVDIGTAWQTMKCSDCHGAMP